MHASLHAAPSGHSVAQLQHHRAPSAACQAVASPNAGPRTRAPNHKSAPPPQQQPVSKKQQDRDLDDLLERVRSGRKASTSSSSSSSSAPAPQPPAPRGPNKKKPAAPVSGANKASSNGPATTNKRKPPTKGSAATAPAARAPPARSSSTKGPVEALEDLDDLTPEESDRLFDEVSRVVMKGAALNLDDDDDVGDEEGADELGGSFGAEELEAHLKRSGGGGGGGSAAPARFTGFGAPPRHLAVPGRAGAADAGSSALTTPAPGEQRQRQQQQQQQQEHSVRKVHVPVLRVFVYAADAAQTREAIQQAGWQAQVQVVEDLRSSDAIVATKARNGKHNRLQQGDRMARNAGVPFVCVGRHMTRDNLVLGLAPVLRSHRAKFGAVSEHALAQALVVSEAGVSDVAAAQYQREHQGNRLQPGWKDRMLQELGLLPGSAAAAAVIAGRAAGPPEAAAQPVAVAV